MSKLLRLSVLGATSAVVCLAAPIGGSAALAGPVGLAAANAVALPAQTETVHYRRIYHGRSAYYCPPRYMGRTAYAPRRHTHTVIIERRTAYVAAPVTSVAAPIVAAGYPYGYGGYGGYGYGGPGLIGAGAGLLGGLFNVGFGGGWGPGWGAGWGPGWGGVGYGPGWRFRRRWWW